MFVYKPDEYKIGIGIPGLSDDIPSFVEIKDWISVTPQGAESRFQFERGILGEPFLEMSTDSSRSFSLSILQTSHSVEQLRDLYLLQLTGIIGFPFSIMDNSKDSGRDVRHPKSFYPVSWIVGEPQEPLGLEGTAWVFNIQCASGGTIYF